MMSTAPLGIEFATASDLAERVRTGATSPVELVRACLARIEQQDAILRAFITVVADDALATAAEIGRASCRERV